MQAAGYGLYGRENSMKRLTKCILAVLFCVAIACCALAAGCTLTAVKVYLEGDDGISFNEDYVDADEDGTYTTAARGTSFSVNSISTKYYTLETGWNLAGWTLTVDGEEYQIAEDETPLSFSFSVKLKSTYVLHANLTPATETEITLEGGEGITINTPTITAYIGETFSIASQIPNTAYTLETDYELNGWILYVDGVETAMTDGTFIPENGHTYVLKADIKVPVYATVLLQLSEDENTSTGVTINTDYASNKVKVGTDFVIRGYMYDVDIDHVIVSWTLTIQGEEDYSDAITEGKFAVTTEDAMYILTPTTANADITVTIATAEHATFSKTEIGAYNGYEITLSRVADLATMDTGYEITGWTITVNSGTPTTITGDTYTVGTSASTYVLTPVVSQYYYVLVTEKGMTENEEYVSIGTATDSYTGLVKFYVGESYDLPTEDEDYIWLEKSHGTEYGIKTWTVYNGSGVAVTSLSPTDSMSLTSYDNYTLVPNVQHYYTVDLASYAVDDFEMEQIRVYDGDDFTTPAADANIIDNTTGRTVKGWYLTDTEGNLVTALGGTTGIYKCNINIGTTDGYLLICPVLSDSAYPTGVNDMWLNDRADGVYAVTDHGGTTLGVDSNLDVWHYISDYYTYKQDENVAIYTIVNIGSQDGDRHTLTSNYWFRVNTSAGDAGVTLTVGSYYDFSYSLINYSGTDVTLSVYTCSNGFMGSNSESSITHSFASTQHITIAAGATYDFVQSGFYESQAPVGNNNFLTVFQLDTSTDDFVMGIRIGVTEHEGTTSGKLYIDDSVEHFTLTGDWSTADNGLSYSSVQNGTTVTFAYTTAAESGFSVTYTLDTGYELTGWELLNADGSSTGYTYLVYGSDDTGANAFTFTDSALYLRPIISATSS